MRTRRTRIERSEKSEGTEQEEETGMEIEGRRSRWQEKERKADEGRRRASLRHGQARIIPLVPADGDGSCVNVNVKASSIFPAIKYRPE